MEPTRRPEFSAWYDPRMRVAYVISTPEGLGGAEKLVLDLATEGTRRGHPQSIFNPFEMTDEPSKLASAAERVASYHAAIVGANKLLARRWLKARLADFAPDLVLAVLPAAIAVCATLRRGSASVWIASHQHGSHLRQSKKRIKELIDRTAGLRFDRVVGCSEAVSRFLRDTYGYPPARVETILNGWSGKPRPHRGGEVPTIVSVGRLRKEKGHDTLIRAFQIIKAKLESTQLVLIGSGPQEPELRALTRELGVQGSTTFTGDVGDIWPHLAAADAFALSSHHEALGIAVLEAMAAGLPVVASGVGGVPELVEEGRTGYLVPTHDEEALAQGLVKVLSDPERARLMGETGRRAASELRSDLTSDRYYTLFEKVLTEKGAQRRSRRA